ncbi:MAG: alpha/beta fold hydrolase [Actinomycetia bacterium]|nr:alpha/beta fold hydrolase [Actinomycetes bacterium]MCH9700568.1 alpha/beta fold hydrolase [Actinomycetes bacterium]
MAVAPSATQILTDVAKFPLRIGSLAAPDSLRTGLHLGDQVLAAGVHAGEEIERPAVAALRAAGIEVESLHTHSGRKVNYDFFAGVPPEVLNPGGALPGANEWDRPLSKAHPNPVILMHGTAGGAQTNWGAYVPLLVEQGYSPFTLTFGAVKSAPWPLSALGGMAPIEESAAEFGAFVDKVLAATGAEQVDVVGHSQGTLVPGYYAKVSGGKNKIGKYVSLAPLWQGTEVFTNRLAGAIEFHIALDITHRVHFASAPQMIRGSEFLQTLHSGGSPYVPGIRYVNISTRYDEFVRPYTSGQLPGGPGDDVINVVVQDTCSEDFSDHLAIAGSRRAATMVLNALDGSDVPAQGPRQVPCEMVPPVWG